MTLYCIVRAKRLAADYGVWVGSMLRGELSAMRARSETFLGDVEANPPRHMQAPSGTRLHQIRRSITAGIGSDHVDLQAAIDRGITVAEVT